MSPAAVVAVEVEDVNHGAPAEGPVPDEVVQGGGERARLQVHAVGEVEAVPLLRRRAEDAAVRQVALQHRAPPRRR